ncbi:hypothetical protein TBLA_0A10700 [Henningerozyma blattae CBS 6284]|uniref:Transcription factor n=1 Tax=Henningerozyma blattae (strain ATCC 34711 / CBS 6284 / DSM 70876 / NBRC 10599 / NRRL Y-10934 / UCD 77-7) TaxID=1071380 RepID=I2GXJ6_HENB6|nr:hypothetical protein TBLA_0A10700 [Tetrapisispora blattae CBS 6284]CCH58848.1 hypothetical protein TBLA_0A10700 [Tetrapisispora blattae CBS 6284]
MEFQLSSNADENETGEYGSMSLLNEAGGYQRNSGMMSQPIQGMPIEQINSPGGAGGGTGNVKASNDFVRIIYGILEREDYPDIITWSEKGDSFLVLDTGKFTSQILPNHFKHSNFASFVRQLNKYDFHKVKRTQEEKKKWKYGEQSWEFCHPLFKRNHDDGLNNIKRKTSSQKKIPIIDGSLIINDTAGNGTPTDINLNNILNGFVPKSNFEKTNKQIEELKNELMVSREDSLNTKVQLQKLNSKYNSMIESLLLFKNMHGKLLNNFAILCNSLRSRGIELPEELVEFNNDNSDSMHMTNSMMDMNLSRDEFYQQMAPMFQNGSPELFAGANSGTNSNTTPGTTANAASNSNANATNNNLNNNPPTTSTTTAAATTTASAATTTAAAAAATAAATATATATNSSNNVGPYVLRKGFHVLLVEDDEVCIQLCSKFLRKYGCTVRVVTDGLTAISVLENHRFDLVLMDIVMPNLDGATATSIVRNFDNYTPIIAMTGNIEDQDLITYLQHGMNDILAKPFTKRDLHSMLVRYLRDKVPLCEAGGTGNESNGAKIRTNTVDAPSKLASVSPGSRQNRVEGLPVSKKPRTS